MSIGWILLTAALLWIGLIAVIRLLICPWLAHGPQQNAVFGLVWRIVRVYARIFHHVRYEGLQKFRNQVSSGPLVVVSNHTGSVDPLLIQAGCRFDVRWMMASEMMTPWLSFVWHLTNPIPVDRDGRDTNAAREAIRYVQAGHAVGIFPEGRIVWPPGQIRPFFLGVGLIVARAKAPVMLVWISGTPETRDMHKSILGPSRARVVFLDIIDFKGERDAHAIAAELRSRIANASGWPMNDELQPQDEREPQNGNAIAVHG